MKFKDEEKTMVVEVVFRTIFFMGIIIVAVAFIYASFDFARGIGSVYKESQQVTTEKVSLRSVNYSQSIEGSFFLGIGTIQGSDYYVCYQKTQDGGLKLLKLDASTTVIYETLETQEEAYAEISTTFLGEIKDAKMYVPLGTIQTKYDFN